ncbi:PD-(D/E)XK nuclease family protein [Paenibacillus marinisediminis]
MQPTNILNLLTQFTIRNDALEKLRSHIQSFNPLKVLRMNHYEIRHSNVLGWLLDASGNHNLQDKVFKKFMIEVILHAENEQKNSPAGINETFFFLNHFWDLEVHREWNHTKKQKSSFKRLVDLLLISHQHKLAIIIENKVYSGEGVDQLSEYNTMVESAYPGYNIIPIYMTLFGDQPSDERYFIFSHLAFYLLLNQFIPSQFDHMNQKVYEFIQDYLKVLEELILPDKTYVELCEELYLKHRQAIELILSLDLRTLDPHEEHSRQIYELVRYYKEVSSCIKTNGYIDYFKAASKKFAIQQTELIFSGAMGNTAMWFYPKEYETVPGFSSPTATNYQRFCPYPVPYIFGPGRNGRLELKIEIGECAEDFSARRMEFVTFAASQLGISIKHSPKITQFEKETIEMSESDWTNEAVILEKMSVLYSRMQDFYQKIWSCIQQFDWNRH